MRDVRLPFRQAVNPAEMEPWLLKSPQGIIDLPEELPSWDPTIDVVVTRKILVDGARLRDECELADDTRVRLLAGWASENGRSRHFGWHYDLRLPSRFEGSVEVHAPGSELATTVEFIVGAILVASGRKQSPVAASVPGTWIWRDVRQVRLEETSGRFPMEWTDFKRSGLPPEAPWFLDWPSQDWQAPLLGTLRLRLNATNAFMRKVVDLPESDPKRRIAIRSAILDVAKQLILAALHSDEFLEQHSAYTEGSVGFSIRLLLGLAFPNDSLETVRTLLRDHAGMFHVRLQAGLIPFGDVAE